MKSGDLDTINKIIIDLLLEFQNEQNRLQVMYDNGTSRLLELEEDIVSYKDTEDVDFKVFSPRNVSNLSEEKLMAMDREKTNIEDGNKELLKQLKYYNDKVEKLRTVLTILDETEIDNTEYISTNNEEEINSSEQEIDPIDLELSNIRRLFSAKKDSESDETRYTLKQKKEVDVPEEESSLENITKDTSNSSDDVESSNVLEDKVSNSSIKELNDYESRSLLDDLDRISHRIEISYKVIDNDVFRTKMELKSIKSGIDDIIRGIKK